VRLHPTNEMFLLNSVPQSVSELQNCLAEALKDSDRAYMKKLTHLHEWQFFALAEKLEPLIICAQQREDGSRPEVCQRPPSLIIFIDCISASVG
jgi:hypothetical protein